MDGLHVLVDRAGLEGTDVREVVGSAPDDSGDRHPGLALLSEAEHVERVARLG